MYAPTQWENCHNGTSHNRTAAMNLFYAGKTVSDILQSRSRFNTKLDWQNINFQHYISNVKALILLFVL